MKRKLNNYDYVGYHSEDSESYEYGIIYNYNKKQKKYEIAPCKSGETIFLSEDEIEFMPRKILYAEDMLRLLRYELNYEDFTSDIVPIENYSLGTDSITYTLDDVSAMIDNLINKAPDEKEFSDWLYFIFSEELVYYFDCPEEPIYLSDPGHIKLGFSTHANESAIAESVFNTLFNLCQDDIYGMKHSDLRPKIDLKQIQRDIKNFRAGKPIKEYLWSEHNKKRVCDDLKDNNLGLLNKKLIEDTKKIINELVASDDPDALEALGYACYGDDNPVFKCDWVKSRDCFLKLYAMENVYDLKRCYFANTLGYIFYYGRCNNGVPEYDFLLSSGSTDNIKPELVVKAFHEFIGLPEFDELSLDIKRLDMFTNGYGTEKNNRAASCLVSRVYEENLKLIKKEKYECKFADAALRMGNLCRDGIQPGNAYYYYTLADFAIRKRAVYGHYGDDKVFTGIQKELEKIREENPLKKSGTLSASYIPDIVDDLFHKHSCQVTVKKTKNGLSFKVKRLPKPGKEKASKEFECLPDYGYCRLTDSKTFKASGVTDVDLKGTVKFIADDYDVYGDFGEEYSTAEFYHHGETVFSFKVKKFTHTLKSETDKETK